MVGFLTMLRAEKTECCEADANPEPGLIVSRTGPFYELNGSRSSSSCCSGVFRPNSLSHVFIKSMTEYDHDMRGAFFNLLLLSSSAVTPCLSRYRSKPETTEAVWLFLQLHMHPSVSVHSYGSF